MILLAFFFTFLLHTILILQILYNWFFPNYRKIIVIQHVIWGSGSSFVYLVLTVYRNSIKRSYWVTDLTLWRFVQVHSMTFTQWSTHLIVHSLEGDLVDNWCMTMWFTIYQCRHFTTLSEVQKPWFCVLLLQYHIIVRRNHWGWRRRVSFYCLQWPGFLITLFCWWWFSCPMISERHMFDLAEK